MVTELLSHPIFFVMLLGRSFGKDASVILAPHSSFVGCFSSSARDQRKFVLGLTKFWSWMWSGIINNS